MPRKSSIHFKPLTNIRFAVSHSERTDLSEPAYLLPKEHQLGNVVVAGSLSENDLAALFIKQKESMTGQAKARASSPFWEGVVVLSDTNSQNQSTNLQAWKNAYEKETGHKVLHMSIHLDEGYMDESGKPQYNPHAHVIVSRMDEKNRVISLGRKQLANVQDLTAEQLKMERGSTLAEREGRRGRKHIPHQEFRVVANEKRLELEKPKAQLAKLKQLSKQWSDTDLAKVKKLETRLAEDKQAAESELSKKAARIARMAVLIEAYKKKRAELKASGVATQKEYQQLKKAHEADLAKLEAELKTAQTEAAKVPELLAQAVRAQAQIDQLTREATKVPGLEAQALELAQLKETIATRLKPAAIADPRSAYHPDNLAKRQAKEAAEKSAKPVAGPQTEQMTPEQAKAEEAYWAKRQAKRQSAPQQEAKTQKTEKPADLASLPIGDQAQVFDFTLSKFTKIRQEKLNRVSVKLLKRQERRQKAVQAVLNSRPPEPTGMLAALKRGAYDKAMDALEPIYLRAKKLAKQAELVTQKVSEAAKQAHSWAYAKLKKADPGLVQRVETHRMNERMEVARRQIAAQEAQKALKGPDKGISR